MSTTAPLPQTRRWPRRLALGLAVSGVLLGGAAWVLGRESTLQMLMQRLALASGGQLAVSGVSGTLYGTLHVAHLRYRSPTSTITAEQIDISWSVRQFWSSGLAISGLSAASVTVDSTGNAPPSGMPRTLAPPFQITIGAASLGRLTLHSAGAATVIDALQFQLDGDSARWLLRDASAATPWGKLAANASVQTVAPFRLSGTARLSQSAPAAGQAPATLDVTASGDLAHTGLTVQAQSGPARASATLALTPFDTVPLRALQIDAHGINPALFDATLPGADLKLALSANIDARGVSGAVTLSNEGVPGTLDQQRLPLRALSAKLSGSLSALQIGELLIDLGAAGTLSGQASVLRDAGAPDGAKVALALRAERIDLKAIHGKLKTTRIAGTIALTQAGATQTLNALLAQDGLRLETRATFSKGIIELQQARLLAGAGSLRLSGRATLGAKGSYQLDGAAAHFDPAAFGAYPHADLNADLALRGALTPAWNLAAEFGLKPSRLFDQPLSGQGKFNADAQHVSAVALTLALGENALAVNGAIGAPGERLQWRLDAHQLNAVHSELAGALSANGVVSGTLAAPRTSFALDAKGLSWNAAARASNDSQLHATGDAALNAQRGVALKASGTAQGVNPASFGAPVAGSINGNIDIDARSGSDWQVALKLALQGSTLAKAALSGTANIKLDANHIGNAEVDLKLGANRVTTHGAFGAPREQLTWRIDAPELAALGPNFAGVLNASGTLAGTRAQTALTLTANGRELKLFGAHALKTLRASASIGAGAGAGDALVSDIAIQGYAGPAINIAAAQLRSDGTRGAHRLHLAARGDQFDASVDVAGALGPDSWSGSVGALQNKGRYAVTLQAPMALRVAGTPGAGLAGLLHPHQLALSNAVFALPGGSVNLQSLDKNGPRWTSRGQAAGVPLNYLAQMSEALSGTVSGDLTLGAAWSLDLQTAAASGAAPALAGMLHVFRERGDAVMGADVPVALGLRQLDARAELANGALRLQFDIDGSRAGRAHAEATAQLLQGRVGNNSALTLKANADMGSIAWLAPLSGQPALELDGALKASVVGSGTIGAPLLNGDMAGERLALRWADQGVKLSNGVLRAQLAGDQLQLQKLSFDGPEGHAQADGWVRFAGGEASMQLKLVADKLEILARPDRTVVLSGQTTLVRDQKRFELSGKVRAERALIELAPQDRPTLSDDVVVLGRAGAPAKPAAGSLPLNIELDADLGPSFTLRGMGIDAQLAGALSIRTQERRPARVNGSVRVVSGTYAAYGQKLAIERGLLNFTGAYDNPGLSILALRKRPEGDALTETNVEAGVEVRGTALAPVAKLVSTPSVPDSEKLSWLVLGHGTDSTAGPEAGVLSAAAAALIGGSGGNGLQSRLASTFGVDELGLAQAKGLEATVVTVGKRLSQRAYLSFEQGASTATSLVKLRYKLNPRVTLQLQTGANTALDVLYSWAFD